MTSPHANPTHPTEQTAQAVPVAAGAQPLHTAQNETGEHTAAAHEEAPKSFMMLANEWNLISFTVVVLILIWAIRKAGIGAGLQKQRAAIVSDIETIEAERQKALDELNALKHRTARLKDEVKKILDDATQAAQGLSSQIIEDAEGQAAKVLEGAKKRIEMEEKSAVGNLQRRLLNDALDEARAELAQDLTASQQKQSVDDFIQSLSK
ncbi:MAG: hypothetical protein AB7P76_08735 [Candidatus Melainabacteria bacterium]